MDTEALTAPVSRVTLVVDGENSYTAGDDTGRAIEKTLPWATQAMAESILRSLQGVEYQPFSGSDALLDPAAEVGDGITVGGVYSVLAKVGIIFDGLYTADIAAPGGDEVEDEYPYKSRSQRQEERKLARVRSSITKTAEQILLKVENELNGLSSSLDVELNSITSRVEDAESGLSQTLRIAADGVTITNAQGDILTIDGGQIDASKIKTEQLDASKIHAEDLNLTGAISWGDLDDDTRSQVTSAQSTASSALTAAYNASSAASDAANKVSGWTYGGTTYIDGSKLMTGTVRASTIQGGSVSLLDYYGNPSGVMSITPAQTGAYAVDITSYSALRLTANSGLLFLDGGPDIAVGCQKFYPMGYAPNLGDAQLGMWNAVYAYTAEIITSDRNSKHDIEPIPDKYMDMLDRIEPVRFKVNNGTSGRYHVGFVAQDVEAAMESSEVDPLEFAGWCKDKGSNGAELQMLRYTEFIPLCIEKLRRLTARVAELEGRTS